MKLRIHKSTIFKDLLTWFLLFPFFEPDCIEYLAPTVDTIYKVWASAAMVVILLLYLTWSTQGTMPKNQIRYICLLSFFLAALLASTIINKAAAGMNYIGRLGMIVALCMLIQMGYSMQGKRFLNKLTLYLECLIWISFLVGLNNGFTPLYRASNGFYGFFLGNKNGLTPVYLLTFAVFVYREYLLHEEIALRKKLYLTALALTILPFRSGTGTLCCAIFLLILYLGTNKSLLSWLTYARVWFVYAGITVVIVFLRATQWLKPLFDLIQKDVTLTGRTILWEKSVALITSSLGNFVIGHGHPAKDYLAMNGNFYSSHNLIMEIMYQGGIACLSLFCLLIASTFLGKIERKENRLCLLNWCMMILLFATLTESHLYTLYVYAMITVFNLISANSVNWSSKHAGKKDNHCIMEEE